ncbi:MAG: hypothetical protein KIT14_23435 [bacterium]|nr:hypothetical protein [bacterium]
MHRLVPALLLLAFAVPAVALAKPQCKVKRETCPEAKERCIATSTRVLECRPGKEKRCRRIAGRACTRQIKKCCRKNPLETCCGAGTFGGTPTTTIGGGVTTTTTTSGSTTTTIADGAPCSSSLDCAGFACCNLAKGQCCTLGSGSAACSGATVPPVLAGSAGCTSNDGIDFPPTPAQCGPTRPAQCPPEAVSPVGYQCHICGDGKIMQTLYDTVTGQRTSYP